jgi:hypothetical protein
MAHPNLHDLSLRQSTQEAGRKGYAGFTQSRHFANARLSRLPA